MPSRKVKRCQSQASAPGTGFGGIGSLCPTVGLRPPLRDGPVPQMHLLGSGLIVRCARATPHPATSGKAIHSGAVQRPQLCPSMGMLPRSLPSPCPGPSSGTMSRGDMATLGAPRAPFCDVCVSCAFGGISCTHEIGRGFAVKAFPASSPALAEVPVRPCGC